MSRLIKIADWSGKKRGNVVFVHGLGGHPYDTWRRAANDVTLWPLWLAEDVPGLSVYTLGYVSPATNWIGTAMPLLDEAAHTLRLLLNAQELRDGPIAFVCHSLGGLIVKQVIRSANEQRGDPEAAEFLARVRQVIFIATPHTGSGKATLIETLGFWTWGSDSVRDLVANKPELRDLNFGYREVARAQGDRLRHLSYYEMTNTIFGRIVQPDAADPGLPGCKPTPIRENHISIAKPRRRDDLVYLEVKTLVSTLAPPETSAETMRAHVLEPFDMERSWAQLVPKLVRIIAIGLVAAALWLGVPRLYSVYSAIFHIQDKVAATDAKTDEILRIVRTVAQKENVPLDTLRAILKEMGEAATTAEAGEISRLLTVKATEFKALIERLNRLSQADPEVARLQRQASDDLNKGRFAESDSNLALAEARDLAGSQDLEALARKKRLSAAETRAGRGAAAMLRPNPDAYRQAADHYSAAAQIAAAADPGMALGYAIQHGQALVALGSEFGQNAVLLEAVGYFQAMLAADPNRSPLDRAMIQSDLGVALWSLGERESGTARLEEAVTVLRAALLERTRERVPLDWAQSQNDLGLALWNLGERESGTVRLEEAAAAFRAALLEYTRERFSREWAITQNNLGLVLWRLGEREGGTARLELAVAAYSAALSETPRERMPLEWARTQKNLGLALWRLGEQETGTERFEAAVAAHRAALQESTRVRVPIEWARTQNDLGLALAALGARANATARFEEAVAAYRNALLEQRRDRVPLEWAQTQNNLGLVLLQIGERENGTARLEQAVVAFRDALLEKTGVPFDRSLTEQNLEAAEKLMAGRRK